MTTVYRKTDKGINEVATRANKLVPRLRTALILVDGARDDDVLSQLIAHDPEKTLGELLSMGYIEAASVTEAAPSPSAAKAAAEPPGATAERSFASFRAEAVRAFNDLTGPAGEALAIKMERATSREQLAPLLQTAYQIIGNSRGAQAATEFKAQFASF
jgi:hypothetical protein